MTATADETALATVDALLRENDVLRRTLRRKRRKKLIRRSRRVLAVVLAVSRRLRRKRAAAPPELPVPAGTSAAPADRLAGVARVAVALLVIRQVVAQSKADSGAATVQSNTSSLPAVGAGQGA